MCAICFASSPSANINCSPRMIAINWDWTAAAGLRTSFSAVACVLMAHTRFAESEFANRRDFLLSAVGGPHWHVNGILNKRQSSRLPGLSTSSADSDYTLHLPTITNERVQESRPVSESVQTDIAPTPLTPGHIYFTSATDLTAGYGPET